MSRLNICKNYRSTVIRSLSDHLNGRKEIDVILEDLITDAVVHICCLEEERNFYRDESLKYLYSHFFGKVVYQSKNLSESLQYKIKNRQDVNKHLFIIAQDSNHTRILKLIVQQIIIRYLQSPLFIAWVKSKYDAKFKSNKSFLLNNIVEISNVFLYPDYRPRFIYRN